MRRSRILVFTMGALGLSIVAACGDDDSDTVPMTGNRPTTTTEETTTTVAGTSTTDEAASFPVSVDAANGSVEIAAQPVAIASLSPTATEMLYAIGAGDQVVAVDQESDYPADAPIADLVAADPNVDAIIGYQPDLVLVESETVVPGLNSSLAAPVVVLPPATSLDDSYAQIELLGQATGHPTAAGELVDGMRSDVQALAEQVSSSGGATVYHEVDPTPSTIASDSLLGELYLLAGLNNIAATIESASPGPVPIASQQVIDANPDWIFLAYGGDAELAQVVARPGWGQLTAVQGNHVLVLDPDIASRWGPRTVELLQTIIEATAPTA
jgi:iron complex transport system substrate-binding protein